MHPQVRIYDRVVSWPAAAAAGVLRASSFVKKRDRTARPAPPASHAGGQEELTEKVRRVKGCES
jgi:hypothetical protein